MMLLKGILALLVLLAIFLIGRSWRDERSWPISIKILFPLIYYPLLILWLVLALIFLPPLYLFLYFYGWMLCALAWRTWGKRRTDVLVVHTSARNSEEWMAQIAPLVEGRAVRLNYDERKSWRLWSLPVQLFHRFGPHPMPERVMPHFLPAVILFKRFRKPKKFTFGERSKEREAKIEQLRSELGRG